MDDQAGLAWQERASWKEGSIKLLFDYARMSRSGRAQDQWAGLKKPLGTGPVIAVTGLTGPARFRIRAVRNRAKFKF